MTDTAAVVAGHPAKWSAEVMEGVIGPLLRAEYEAAAVKPLRVLDPFCGVGLHRIAQELPVGPSVELVGVEIQPEWAVADQRVLVGDASDLPAEWSGRFNLVVTSPAFSNRMADSHEARDRCKACNGLGTLSTVHGHCTDIDGGRWHAVGSCTECSPPCCPPCKACKGEGLSWRNTYAHALRRAGGDLVAGSAAGMNWGYAYRELHTAAVMEWERVLRPGGKAIVNMKNHVRGGDEQLVVEWWLNTATARGWGVEQVVTVPTPGNRYGANSQARVPDDKVLVLVTPTRPGLL